MNAVREALADRYHQYQIPSKEEVLDKIKSLKREFPKVTNREAEFLEKEMTRKYDSYRREMVKYGAVFGLVTLLGAPGILQEVSMFKNRVTKDLSIVRTAFEEANKVPPQDQYNVVTRIWNDYYITDNTNQEKLKREEEVEVPLVTPIPKEMGTTNPLVRPDATETINPLARK